MTVHVVLKDAAGGATDIVGVFAELHLAESEIKRHVAAGELLESFSIHARAVRK